MADMELTDLGEIAYQAYGDSTGGLTYNGRSMPAWEDLTPAIRGAWRYAASAVRDAVRDTASWMIPTESEG